MTAVQRGDRAGSGPGSAWDDVLSRHGTTRRYPARAMIVHEGNAGDMIYLIVTGSAQVFSTNEAGKVVVYNTLGAGELIGEPTLDGGSRSASVMTLEPTTCSTIGLTAFRELVANDPSIAMHVIRNLIRLLRISNAHVKSLALDDVHGRVVTLLSQYAVPDGKCWRVRHRLTHQAIAEHVGSSREMVGRVMVDLRAAGYLGTDDHAIVVLKRLPASRPTLRD